MRLLRLIYSDEFKRSNVKLDDIFKSQRPENLMNLYIDYLDNHLQIYLLMDKNEKCLVIVDDELEETNHVFIISLGYEILITDNVIKIVNRRIDELCLYNRFNSILNREIVKCLKRGVVGYITDSVVKLIDIYGDTIQFIIEDYMNFEYGDNKVWILNTPIPYKHVDISEKDILYNRTSVKELLKRNYRKQDLLSLTEEQLIDIFKDRILKQYWGYIETLDTYTERVRKERLRYE